MVFKHVSSPVKRAQGGFTLTEATLSTVIWGMLIVPFLVYYGTMQRALYISHSEMDVLHVSRLTMDQVSDDLRRMETVGTISGWDPVHQLCFSYTPVDSSGTVQTARNVYYQWDTTNKKLRISQGTGDLNTFCGNAPDGNVPPFGNDAFISDVSFAYYDDLGNTVSSPTASPQNFTRVGLTMNYRAQPDSPAYFTASSQRLRNASPPATGTILRHIAAAAIPMPYGITVDLAGKVWITDQIQNKVSRIDPVTQQTLTVTNGLANPQELAVDLNGNIWVSNYGGGTVTKLDPSTGALLAIGTATGAGAVRGRGIAVDGNNNVWATDESNAALWEFNNGGAAVTSYSMPAGSRAVAVDPSGNIWVGCFGDGTNAGSVTRLNPSTGIQTNFTGFNQPVGIAVDGAGVVWVSNYADGSVTRFDPSTNTQTNIPLGLTPYKLVVDGAGNVWADNYNDSSVTKIAPDGTITGTYATKITPYGIAVDGAGNVWVTNNDPNPAIRGVSELAP